MGAELTDHRIRLQNNADKEFGSIEAPKQRIFVGSEEWTDEKIRDYAHNLKVRE